MSRTLKLVFIGIFIVMISGILEVSLYAQEAMAPVPIPKLKRRLAVFSFEDKTDYGRFNVGEGMSDMLVTELVKGRNYIIIERQQIAQVMAEQALGQSGAVTQQTAAQVGKLLGVELAVFGSVTEFGEKKSETGGKLKKFGIGGGISKSEARVAIDVRIVDTGTGQILAADNVEGEEKKTGLSVDTKDFSFADRSKFDKTQVGKATRKAIEKIMKKIDDQMKSKPWSGKIIKVSGPKLYINGGSNIGLLVGNVMKVFSPGEELIDPDTGLSLGAEETRLGEIQIVDVKEKYSIAIVRSGAGFSGGNIVRP
ncbi:MAG: hypothetical protein GY855_02130 [candidate division Zixibacteria bacterium]|nr:hypothetical protein [candidate division Zixibacteria bacterium]